MLHRLQRLALLRAFRAERSRAWLVVGTAAWLLRTANRLRLPESETVYRTRLEPGEQLVVDHLPIDRQGRPTRRSRRR